MNRFVINISMDGQHYAKVTLPDTDLDMAKHKAKSISAALIASWPAALNLKFTLTRWNDVGVDITI